MTVSDPTTNHSNETRRPLRASELIELATNIKRWGQELGFDHVGISDIDLEEHEQHLQKWVSQGMHGEMDYMHKHGKKRSRPNELIAGTRRVISVRMDYAPAD